MSALPLPAVRSTTILGRPLMTVAEVAEHLRVSEMTVYRLITSRELGATKIGRSWRVPADDLVAYLEDRHVTKAG
jgi:excisionase family DNA binding protein